MMRALVSSAALVICLGLAGGAAAEGPAATATSISGAGGSSPAPLLKAWAADYRAAKGVSVTYEAVNSAYGIAQIEGGKVDFGDTEAPLSDDDLAKNGLSQFPYTLVGLTPVINVPGIESGKLRLDGPLLAAIFSGAVTKWDDPRIKALNPDLALPDWAITVAHRSDKAALTFLLTTYLSSVSPAWKAGPGAGDTVNWPAGLGGKGNAGIAEIMGGSLGTIGYVEYAYAKANKLDLVVLKSHDGAFVEPDLPSFTAAAAGADWSKTKGFAVQLLDKPGAKSWPLVGASYVLLRNDAPAVRRQMVQSFFDAGYQPKGDAAAVGLGYAPLPASVEAQVRKSW